MKKYGAGEIVRGGTYLNLATGQFLSLDQEAAVLPEGGESKFVRVPLALALIFGPLAGLAYIIFLPLMGIATLFMLATRKAQTQEPAVANEHKAV
jgi:hypothetical protein